MESPENPPLNLPEKFWVDLENQLGKPYKWAAEVDKCDGDPQAFDCSELVEWAFDRVGIDLPDGSWNIYAKCLPVDKLEAMPGDLLFFCDTSRIDADRIKQNPAGVYHVGILWKDCKKVIDARAPWRSHSGAVLFGKVMFSPREAWESWRHFGGYRRVKIK